MRSHAKASTAGSTQRQATGLGRIFRGADAGRAPSPRAAGSGATSRRLLACLPLALLLAALFAASAQAAPETIAEYGEGAGHVRLPASVAVEQTSGDFYVADRNDFRVEKFDSAGNFLLAWGWGVTDRSEEFQICGPAASPPTKRCFGRKNPAGSVYPAGAVYPEAVAVDQSSGAVYVADPITGRVSKFSPSGELLYMVGRNVNKTKAEEIGGPYTQEEKNVCSAADLEAGEECRQGDAGTGPREFSSSNPRSIAVDAAGQVWVGDKNRIVELNPDGTPAGEVELAGAGRTNSLALDSSGNFYVRSASLAGIRKLEAGTGALLETYEATNNPKTVTLDEADNVYIGHCVVSNCFGGPPYRFVVYNPAGEQVSQFGKGQVIGEPEGNALAIDNSAGTLYVASSGSSENNSAVQAFPLPEPGPLPENQPTENLLPTTVTLAADLNPEGHETTWHFEWGTSESYGESSPVETLAGEEFDSEAVAAELEELIPETTYHFRLVATNHCNNAEPAEECTVAGPDTSFTTPPAVAFESQWATGVAAHSATLHAEANPLGVEAQWWVEYGTSAAYGSQTAKALLPAGLEPVSLATLLTGLSPATTYHYRFAASDERDGVEYTAHGADRTFTTQLSGLGFSLADNRAWEMVSPTQKYGALIGGLDPTTGGVYRAAADGSAVAYLSTNSTEAAPEGSRVIEQSSILARRGSGGAWANRDLTPPHTEVTQFPLGYGLEYRLFSSDLSLGVLEARDETLLSPEASERTPYLRHNTEPATYTPLVTGKEGFANVPPGTEFGGEPGSPLGAVHLVGATPDLSHVLLAGATLAAGGGRPYEWSAGEMLQPVGIAPAGEGGGPIGGYLGSGEASTRKAISDDGSRVFWTAGSGNALYVRDMDREETARLDVVQEDAFGTGAADPVFQGADAAGTVAFFTDTQNLTEDANEAGADLYRCEVTTAGEELGCDLTDITANGGESAEVQGLAAGMSEDASEVYFVAGGVLASNTVDNGAGPEAASPGEPNLYLWQQGAGIRFIATLSDEDRHDWGAVNPTTCCYGVQQSAAASPSGRYLAFMSQRSLTGYDNRDELTEELDQEVFRYDAATDQLICASCNPSGASPRGLHGYEGALAASSVLSDPEQIWNGVPLAATLPEATKVTLSGPSLYRTRAVHDNGRLYFNAADALVPADSNGNWDVYQYEPTGSGDCSATAGGAAVSRSAGGCVSLLSSGTGEGESGFLDASEGGSDVFFITSAKLSVTDEDNVPDVYDARVDGIAATRVPRSECLGEACQSAPAAPNDPTPASATFKGAGNLRYRPDCGALARRTGKLSNRAKRLRLHAKRAHNPRTKRRMARQAKRLAHRAQGLGKQAKRCRRADRGTGR